MSSPFIGGAASHRLIGALGALMSLLALTRPAIAEDPQAAFARAEQHLAAKRLRDAADGFRAIAVSSSDQEIGGRAAMRYLDTEANLIHSGSDEVPAMRISVAKFSDLYCSPASASASSPAKKSVADPQLCPLLMKLECDLTRLQAEERIKAFDKGGDDTSDAAREAGDLYLSMWKTHGEAPMKAGRAPECDRMEEVLYNASRAYQVARLMPQANATRRILVDPQYKLNTTELAKKSVYEVASFFMAVGEYAEAATWFDRFARESAKNDRAPDALSDVVILRIALGQMDEAEEAAGRFLKTYGSKIQDKSATVAFAVGAVHVEKGDYKRAERWLSARMEVIARGPLDVRVRALATLGQALAGLKDEKGAEKQYRGVVSMCRDPAEMVRRISGGASDADARRLGQALTALGEARFFLAELERKSAITDKIPAYKGPADPAALSSFITSKTAPAMIARRTAIEGLEKRYLEILQIQPVPPPKWVVAAASQVAGMWIDMVDELGAIDIKGKPANSGDLAKQVREVMDSNLDPLRQRAKAAAKACLSFSVKFQYTSAYSERCAAWLTRNYPKEFQRNEELAPGPTLLRDGVTRHSPAGRLPVEPD